MAEALEGIEDATERREVEQETLAELLPEAFGAVTGRKTEARHRQVASVSG